MTASIFTSCEKVAEEVQGALEVTVNTDLEVPFTVVPDAAKSVNSTTFTINETLDPSSNSDIADNLSKIKSIEVTKITVIITSVSPTTSVLESSDFSLTQNVEGGSSFSFSSPANTPLIAGSKFEVGTGTPGWENVNQIISSMITSSTTASITGNGSINQDDFSIGFIYAVSVKIVVKP